MEVQKNGGIDGFAAGISRFFIKGKNAVLGFSRKIHSAGPYTITDNRYIILAFCLIYSCLTGPGYLNLEPVRAMLYRSGAFSWLCDFDDTHEVSNGYVNPNTGVCAYQRLAIGQLYSTIVVFHLCFSVFAGIIYDSFGAKFSFVLGTVFQGLGWTLLGISHNGLRLYTLGAILLGIGNEPAFFSVFATSHLFPKHRNFVISVFGACRSIGFMIPFLIKLMAFNLYGGNQYIDKVVGVAGYDGSGFSVAFSKASITYSAAFLGTALLLGLMFIPVSSWDRVQKARGINIHLDNTPEEHLVVVDKYGNVFEDELCKGDQSGKSVGHVGGVEDVKSLRHATSSMDTVSGEDMSDNGFGRSLVKGLTGGTNLESDLAVVNNAVREAENSTRSPYSTPENILQSPAISPYHTPPTKEINPPPAYTPPTSTTPNQPDSHPPTSPEKEIFNISTIQPQTPNGTPSHKVVTVTPTSSCSKHSVFLYTAKRPYVPTTLMGNFLGPAFVTMLPYCVFAYLRNVYFTVASEHVLRDIPHIMEIMVIFSFLPAPLFGIIAEKCGIHTVLHSLNVMATLMYVISMIGGFPASYDLQIVSCVAYTLQMSFLLSQFYVFSMKYFKDEFIGTLLGALTCLAGLSSLLGPYMHQLSVFVGFIYFHTMFVVGGLASSLYLLWFGGFSSIGWSGNGWSLKGSPKYLNHVN